MKLWLAFNIPIWWFDFSVRDESFVRQVPVDTCRNILEVCIDNNNIRITPALRET